MARQKAGAYSFRVEVRHAPVASFPTALCVGSSLRTLYLCRNDIISGKFTHMSSVGLGDFEPIRPWANFSLCTPGSCMSTWTSGNFHIDADPSRSVGSAGCSSIPTLPASAVSKSASREKHRRQFPTLICMISRIAKLLCPQSCSSSLRTRGRCGWGWSAFCSSASEFTFLTRDHVSHGGPARNAST